MCLNARAHQTHFAVAMAVRVFDLETESTWVWYQDLHTVQLVGSELMVDVCTGQVVRRSTANPIVVMVEDVLLERVVPKFTSACVCRHLPSESGFTCVCGRGMDFAKQCYGIVAFRLSDVYTVD